MGVSDEREDKADVGDEGRLPDIHKGGTDLSDRF